MSVACDCCVCCPVNVSGTGRSLVQACSTECGVILYDLLRTSIMRRPWSALCQEEDEEGKRKRRKKKKCLSLIFVVTTMK